jgi:hypothetical protein
MLVERAVELTSRSAIEDVFEIARAEGAPLTTPQPGTRSRT